MPKLAVVAVLLAALAAGAQEPAADSETIARWVRELDDDDPAVRAAAARALGGAGEAARAPVEEAARAGSPEAQAAAAQILRVLERSRLYRQPEFAEGAKRLDRLGSADPVQRRQAVGEWLAAEGRSGATVEKMLAVLKADPEGPCGTGAALALNYLLAPTRTLAFERQPDSWTWGGAHTVTLHLGAYVGAAEFSEQAKAALDALWFEDGGNGRVPGERQPALLDSIVGAAAAGGVVLRLPADAGPVRFEMPAEAAAGWAAQWQALRQDTVTLAMLELVPMPDIAAVPDPQLPAWLDLLDCWNAQWRLAARGRLRELPDARLRLVQERAARAEAGEGLRAFAEQLKLRAAGWIVFQRAAAGGGPQVWVMRADGSGARRLTEGFTGPVYAQVDRGGGRVWVAAGAPPERAGLYVTDVAGDTPLRRIGDASGTIHPSPDGRWAIVAWGAQAASRVDLESGKAAPLGETPTGWIEFSRAGDRAAWFGAGYAHVTVCEAAGGALRTWAGPGKLRDSGIGWLPDGGAVACVAGEAAEGAEPTRWRIAKLDPASGGWSDLTPAYPWISPPRFSPDGGRMAYCRKDEEASEKAPSALEILDLAGGELRVLENPSRRPCDEGDALFWTADGTWLVFRSTYRSERTFVRPEAGGEWKALGETRGVAPVPGLPALVEEFGGDIRIHLLGGRSFNLTESGAAETAPMAVPARR